jgi:OOP family OmpA-OmpF porin
MKKHAIALAALIGAASAQAQVYGTIAGGTTHLGMDCAGTTSCDTSGTGVKLVGGYEFGNGFSVEACYIGFGKFRAADNTASVTMKPTAITLGGAFAMPLGSDWGMNVRLGIAQVKTKASATVGSVSGSESESKAKVYAGLGVTYAISKAVKFELGVDSTQSEIAGEKGTVRLISLGATFSF